MSTQRRKKPDAARLDHSRPAITRVGQLGLLLVVVCLIVTATYWPVLSAQAFSFDDPQYVFKNPLVKNPSWNSTACFFNEVLKPSTVAGYYQPLTMTSLMLDYALGGRQGDLHQFHRTNLSLHIANTALIIVLLYLLFGHVWRGRRGWATLRRPSHDGRAGRLDCRTQDIVSHVLRSRLSDRLRALCPTAALVTL